MCGSKHAVAAAMVGLFSIAIESMAQPETPPPSPPPPPGERADDGPAGDEAPANAPRMRRMLQQRLERIGQEERAMREALDMLDKGEPPERVREHLRGTLRDLGPGGPGEPGGGPGLGGPRRDGPDGRPPMGRGPGDGPQRGVPPVDRPEPGGGMDGMKPPPLDRLMDVLRETNPRMHERLSRLRREKPAEFQRMIDDFAPRLSRLAEERERFPDRWPDRVRLLQLHPASVEAAREAARLPDDRRPEAMQRLRDLLNEQFDIRLKFARQDLLMNERQRERIQREIDESTSSRAQMIERRMQEMIDHELARD